MRRILTMIMMSCLLFSAGGAAASETMEETGDRPDSLVVIPGLGFSVAPMAEAIAVADTADTAQAYGLRVVGVDEGGIAAGLGVLPDSWVTGASTNDSTLRLEEGSRGDWFADVCASAEPGGILILSFHVEGMRSEIRLLVPGDKGDHGPRLGIQLGYMAKRPDGTVPPGVLVAGVFEGTVAEAVGIMKNDVVVAWNGEVVNDPIEFQKAAMKTGSGEMVTVTLIRSDEELRMGFKMP